MPDALHEKLILGTVQLGLDYGINNQQGKPDSQQAMALLEAAYAAGIRTLDTAEAYGNALDVIGDYHRLHPNQPFQVISKFKGLPAEPDEAIQRQLDRLHVPQLAGLLYHRYGEFDTTDNHLERLQHWQQNGWVNDIGVSVYTNEEAVGCCQSSAIQVIQLPFNLLDNRQQRESVLALAAKVGIAIHTRSVFLQGLFFMDPGALPAPLLPLQPHLMYLHRTLAEQQWSVQSAALLYALSQNDIQNVLIGVDSAAQLKENLAAIAAVADQAAAIAQQFNTIQVAETHLLNPANWKL